MIYVCGPEVMVKKIFEITEARKLPMKRALSGLCVAVSAYAEAASSASTGFAVTAPFQCGAMLREMKDELGISKIGFDGSRIPF